MQKIRLLIMAILCTLCFGCGDLTTELAAELIDIAGEPDKIYHSGKDLLSGDYVTVARADLKDDKSEPVSLRFDKKGWKMSEDGSAGLHIYEMTPEEGAKIFSPYDQNTMQCAETVKVTDFKICTAPVGTRIHTAKVDKVMETGYIVIYEDNWHHAHKK